MRGSRKEARRLLQVLLRFPPLWEHVAANGYPSELPLYLLFSGGPDSTALALTLMEFSRLVGSPPPWKHLRPLFGDAKTAEMARPFLSRPRRANLTLLHLNHCIRQKADQDAQWVRGFAHRHSVACAVEKVDVPELSESRKRSLEEVGRTERYRLLARYLEEKPPALGFTGHTLDDHAESVLFNLVEQTGLGGLLGIAPVLHRRILRPFLSVSKQELADFLLSRGQVFLTDESNLVPDRPRTYLRHEIIPRLMKINPRVRENILATSSHLRDYEGLFSWALRTLVSLAAAEDARLRRQLALPLMPQVHAHLLSIALWKDEIQDSLSVVLVPILRAFGHEIDWREATQLAKAIQAGASWVRPNARQQGGIQFHPPTSLLLIVTRSAEPCQHIKLDAGTRVTLPEGTLSLRKLSGVSVERALTRLRMEERLVEMTKPPEFTRLRREISYDAVFSSKVFLPLVIRHWQRGDRITLAGGGSAKLSDIFTDRKIPRTLRTYWPVVTDANGNILWLPGLVRGRIARTRRNAQSAYLLRWKVKQ